MTHPLFDAATETAPLPAMLKVRTSNVPDEVPKVFDEAKTLPESLVCVGAEMIQPLFDAATDTAPRPAMLKVRAS